MVPPEKLKPTTPLSQVEPPTTVCSTGIIQLSGHCIATWYAICLSYIKLTEIGTSCGRG